MSTFHAPCILYLVTYWKVSTTLYLVTTGSLNVIFPKCFTRLSSLFSCCRYVYMCNNSYTNQAREILWQLSWTWLTPKFEMSTFHCSPYSLPSYLLKVKHYDSPCDKWILECDTFGTFTRSSPLSPVIDT